MPQDIPAEAGEPTPGFVPECLSGLASPPKFELRWPTPRDKRWMKRLIREEGAIKHSVEDIRAEMLRALKPLWGDEAYEQHAPVLEAFWEASDAFALQSKDDPDLKWEYDPAIEAACQQLELDVAKHWKPLAKMRTDNVEADEISMLAVVAVVLVGWTGLDAEPKRDRGYLTIDGIDDLKEALTTIETGAGIVPGIAWAQLLVACTQRMFLSEDEEKNFASPSPSETPQQSSNPGKDETAGTSPASASSTATPEIA